MKIYSLRPRLAAAVTWVCVSGSNLWSDRSISFRVTQRSHCCLNLVFLFLLSTVLLIGGSSDQIYCSGWNDINKNKKNKCAGSSAKQQVPAGILYVRLFCNWKQVLKCTRTHAPTWYTYKYIRLRQMNTKIRVAF